MYPFSYDHKLPSGKELPTIECMIDAHWMGSDVQIDGVYIEVYDRASGKMVLCGAEDATDPFISLMLPALEKAAYASNDFKLSVMQGECVFIKDPGTPDERVVRAA